MASTFDDICEPNTQAANDEFSYRNSKFHHWITDTFSPTYNFTADKFVKYKRYILWKWKIILVGLCLWLSALIPVIILWHEVMILRIQVSNANNKEVQVSQSSLELVQYEVEDEMIMSSSTTDASWYSSASTSSTLDDVESLVEEKLSQITDKLKCTCPAGMKGEMGVAGPPGRDGTPGLQGLQGPSGLNGSKGEIGERGLLGEKGERGEVGIALTGPKGEKGEHGWPGLKGDRGSSIFG